MNDHPFNPSVDGKTCNEMQYPAYKVCGKGPRANVHTGTRPKPPELEFPYPPCPLCGEDTYCDDDSFRCDSCGAYWSTEGRSGSWEEPDLPVCGATREPFNHPNLEPKYESIRHQTDYCIREKNHDGPHRADQFSEWREVAR